MTETLYGSPEYLNKSGGEYGAAEEYAEQGDTRVVRDLLFSYLVAVEDAAGNATLHPVDAPRDTELTIEQMGIIALEKGERHHSFYTTAELRGGQQKALGTGGGGVSELGEYELAEYIKSGGEGGKALTVDETLALAGTDKDLAHRLLQAENIASDGDPRKGVEVGLTAIIEG